MENYSPFPVLGGPRDGGLNVPTGSIGERNMFNKGDRVLIGRNAGVIVDIFYSFTKWSYGVKLDPTGPFENALSQYAGSVPQDDLTWEPLV